MYNSQSFLRFESLWNILQAFRIQLNFRTCLNEQISFLLDRSLSANCLCCNLIKNSRHRRLREIRFPSFLEKTTSQLQSNRGPRSLWPTDMLVKRESYVIVNWRKAAWRRVMQVASSRSRKPRSHEVWQLFRNIVILDPMSRNYRL